MTMMPTQLTQVGNMTQNNNNMTQNNNNTNNTINNITLNSYGKEDLSHITDAVLDKLIQAPGTMISELLRLIHFNVDKPENMNMCIPNIRDKFIRMFIELEWKLESKSAQIPHLVERSYGMIDDHYNKNKSKYTSFNKKYYKIIQEGLDNDNKNIWREQSNLLEAVLLNGTKKYKDKFLDSV